jgi:hypothetical protein
MKKEMSLWVRITEDGRVIWSAGKKEWLSNPESLKGREMYDVELKGEYEVPDEKEIRS